MKVLLLHLPAGFGLKPEDRAESLGLGYVASVLRRDGHEVEILDAQLQLLDEKQTVREVLARQFDCLGVTAMSQDRDMLARIVRHVKKRRKDAVIVAGGYCPSLDTERFLKLCPEVDVVVRGEGEQVTSELFARIAQGQDWSDVQGIAFKRLESRHNSGEDATVLNPMPKLISDLDSLPFPARDALSQAPKCEWASIASSRGCYHSCSFCSVNAFYELSGGRTPRFRSPEKVVDEMESIIASHGITKFTFVDDDFIGPGKARNHAESIAREIIKRKLKVNISIECRADEVDVDLFKLLKEAGLVGVFLGIESGVQRQLDTYNKRTTVEQNKRAIQIVRELGIPMQPGFIPFDPYVTFEEIQQNVQFVRDVDLWQGKAGPTPVRLVLFPGVPLIEKVKADGLLKDNGKDYDYVFKDPIAGFIWRGFNAMAKTSGFVQRIKARFH